MIIHHSTSPPPKKVTFPRPTKMSRPMCIEPGCTRETTAPSYIYCWVHDKRPESSTAYGKPFSWTANPEATLVAKPRLLREFLGEAQRDKTLKPIDTTPVTSTDPKDNTLAPISNRDLLEAMRTAKNTPSLSTTVTSSSSTSYPSLPTTTTGFGGSATTASTSNTSGWSADDDKLFDLDGASQDTGKETEKKW